MNTVKMRYLILLLVQLLSLSSFTQQYRFTHFNNSANFSDAYVYTITQDSKGYLWYGTSNGAFSYDGFTFKAFTESDSLASNFITASVNHQNSIWFGHRTGELSKQTPTGFKTVLLNAEVSSISQFLSDVNGNLWVATYSSGLYKIDANNEIEHFPLMKEMTILNFQFIDEQTILIGSDDGLRQCSLKNGGIEIIKQFVDIPKTKVSAIIEYEGEYVIATEDKGVFQLNISGKSIESKCILEPIQYSEQALATLNIDVRGNIWIGTFGSGLYLLEKGWVETAPNGLIHYPTETSPYIKVIFQDRDENIWLGNYGSGTTKILINPFQKMDFGNSVTAFTADSSKIIFAIENKIFFGPPNKSESTLIKALDVAEVTALELGGDLLWIGTSNSGLYKLDFNSGDITHVPISSGRLENSINILKAFDSFLWIGTQKGLAKLDLTTGEITWNTLSEGQLSHNVVNDIFIDTKHTVYVATQSNSISVNEKGVWSKITIPSENGITMLNSIVKGPNGAMWIASNGKGVYKIQGDSILNLRESEGLFSDYCYSLQSDGENYIWVTHRNSLSRIDVRFLSIRNVQEYAGIEDTDIFTENSIHIDGKGGLWFGYSEGLINYNPQIENVQSLSPVLSLASFKINGQDYSLNQKHRLSPGKYKVKFDFIGVSLKEPNQVSYQYRLKGYDADWSEITKSRTVTFTNIVAGTYVFEVVASSSEGVTTQPIEFEFSVKRSLWRQWWFYIQAIVIVVILAVSYIKRREYKLVQYNKQLEQGVKDRTSKIQRQNDEITRQGELLIRKNLDITDSIKYASTIQAAIFPPEEILEEALPEHFLINKPKDIVSGDFCWYTKCEDKYIVAVTDCTGHGVPGAIMSMLGITLFNEVVNNLKVTNAGHILEIVRDKVISALNQHKKENPSYDGMNVGLCVIDKKNSKIQYSGAFHNLIHVSDNELDIVKAARTSVGFTPLGSPSFQTHNIKYKKGDMFYLFSDGYQDQFGGEKDRKFTSRKLLNILSSIHDKSVANQKLVLIQTLDHWMGEGEQTDDIILLGFRL